MTSYFLDSSALVKHYLTEPGSTWVDSIINELDNDFVVSQITRVETMSAFARRYRENQFSVTYLNSIKLAMNWFVSDVCQEVLVSGTITEYAQELLQVYPLRGFDAIQLATALDAEEQADLLNLSVPLQFVTSDKNLFQIAQLAELRVINPNQFG